MGYADRFKSRMEVNGLSQFDRAMNTKKRSFNKYFKGALNKELVVIDGVEQYATFQDQNQNNNKDLSDDKYIIVESKSGMATDLKSYGEGITGLYLVKNTRQFQLISKERLGQPIIKLSGWLETRYVATVMVILLMFRITRCTLLVWLQVVKMHGLLMPSTGCI